MGDIWGNVAAMALEDAPPAARSILSGILMGGYSTGYLLAVVFSRALVSPGWRPLFWFGACPPVLIIAAQLLLPETKVFQESQRLRNATNNATKAFLDEGKLMFRHKWPMMAYMLLMSGMCFTSHGSQDLYPTMLKSELEFNPDQVTVTQVAANVGVILGGTLVGYSSQVVGRRLSLLVVIVVGVALLSPYSYTRSEPIMAAAFFFQVCMNGAWGVVPIHLLELSPPKYVPFFSGPVKRGQEFDTAHDDLHGQEPCKTLRDLDSEKEPQAV